MSAIFHRKVDGLISRQQQMLSTLQYVVTMMSMEASAWQEASKQASSKASRHAAGVCVVPPLAATN